MERRTASEYRSAVFRTKSAERTERHAAAKRVPLRRARAASEHFEQLPDKTHRLRREQPSCCGAAMKPSVRKAQRRQVRHPPRGRTAAGYAGASVPPAISPRFFSRSPSVPKVRTFRAADASLQDPHVRSESVFYAPKPPRSADLFHAVPRSVSCGTAKAPPTDAAPDSNPAKRRMRAKALKKPEMRRKSKNGRVFFCRTAGQRCKKGTARFCAVLHQIRRDTYYYSTFGTVFQPFFRDFINCL